MMRAAQSRKLLVMRTAARQAKLSRQQIGQGLPPGSQARPQLFGVFSLEQDGSRVVQGAAPFARPAPAAPGRR